MEDGDALYKINGHRDTSFAPSVVSLHLGDPVISFTGLNTLFEERNSPEKGIGIFAITTISSGTRILCEPPLFALSEYADIIELYDAVQKLSKEEQSPFWALAASTKPHKDVDWIAQLRSSYDGSGPFEALVEQHERAYSIYETNRFTLRSPDGPNDRLGIFPDAARMNHHCTPNVFHRFNANINRLTIHALRDIKPGEEISTSYIDICHPTVERRRLLHHWGFKCRCSTCCSENSPQDLRRKKLQQLMVRMKTNEFKRHHEMWTDGDYANALGIVEEVISLMEEEGMEESDTLGEAFNNAAEYALAIGWQQKAIEWAEKAQLVERKCCGEDSLEYLKATALLGSTRRL